MERMLIACRLRRADCVARALHSALLGLACDGSAAASGLVALPPSLPARPCVVCMCVVVRARRVRRACVGLAQGPRTERNAEILERP